MKARFEDVAVKTGDQALLAYRLDVPAFEFDWHYHPEYELTLILSGSGIRIVGDHNAGFTTGDLVLLGPGLPHTWVSEGSAGCSAIVIQFAPRLFDGLTCCSEFAGIKKLLQTSNQGIAFSEEKGKVSVQDLISASGIVRLTRFFILLDELAQISSDTLASAMYRPSLSELHQNRINAVCRYVQEHLTDRVSLQEAAATAHLAESAFCRFFKKMTGKTFSAYVNDLRIQHASILLADNAISVYEAAFSSGFQSLTYFNRVFVAKRGITPSEFRKQFAAR